MSALDALRGYGDGDSSEEEEEEKCIEDSDREPVGHQAAPQKHSVKNSNPLPSVPLEVLGMFQDREEDPVTHSNPALHDGRTRSFQHVRGNWPTFLYIPVEPTEVLQLLMDELVTILPPSVADMKPVDDLHISVSRTVTLQFHWIEPFVQSLKDVLSLESFFFEFDDVEFYSNDEKSRSFLGFKVGHGSNQFECLVQCVNKCLEEFSLPIYYQNPSFHASFVWCLGDFQQFVDATSIQRIQDCFKKHIQDTALVAQASEVRCKIGNKMFSFSLR